MIARNFRVAAVLSGVCLLLATSSSAQRIDKPGEPYAGPLGETIQAEGIELRLEHRVDMTIKTPGIAITHAPCQAEIDLDYHQRNAVARVKTTVLSCPVDSGTFDITASVRIDSGETQRLVFSETWQTDESGRADFEKDYPIGADVTLVRVRSSSKTCTCATSVLH